MTPQKSRVIGKDKGTPPSRQKSFGARIERDDRRDLIRREPADMRKRVVAFNQHRRARTMPLTNEEKRMRVAEELKADPARSNRKIAEAVGVDDKTVAVVRNFRTNTGTDTQAEAKRKRVEAELQADPNRSKVWSEP